MASSSYFKLDSIVFSNVLLFFFSFTQVHTVPYVKNPEKLQEALLRGNVVLNCLVICWELLASQTQHEVP